MTDKAINSFPLRRTTINIIQSASDALDRLTASLRLTQTDVINRSLQVHDFLEAERQAGGEVFIRRADGTQVLVHML